PTSATAARMRAWTAAGSTGTPSSLAYMVRMRSAGRGRLPVCVVRNRSVLRGNGIGSAQAGANVGTGGSSPVVLTTTRTDCPIRIALRSQSTMLVMIVSPLASLGMRLAAQLADRLRDLRQTTTVGRMIVAEATAVRVGRRPPDASDQVAVGDELAALALVAEKPRSSSVISPVIVKLS